MAQQTLCVRHSYSTVKFLHIPRVSTDNRFLLFLQYSLSSYVWLRQIFARCLVWLIPQNKKQYYLLILAVYNSLYKFVSFLLFQKLMDPNKRSWVCRWNMNLAVIAFWREMPFAITFLLATACVVTARDIVLGKSFYLNPDVFYRINYNIDYNCRKIYILSGY